MSSFAINTITSAGLDIIAQTIAGGTLEFTKMQVGDGEFTGTNPMEVTALTNPLIDIPINRAEVTGPGTASVLGAFSNQDMTIGFFYRELGLFAKDPTTGEEKLYVYGNASAAAEWIPPAGTETLIEKQLQINTVIGNAKEIIIQSVSDVYALQTDMDKRLAKKADLDDSSENGGRILAEQMRFDESQTIYIDAAAAAGGDGSENKPFKTVQEAVDNRYLGAAVIYMRIKAGTYAERVHVPRAPGTAWRFEREGAGVVSLQGMQVDNCNYLVMDNITFDMPASATEPECILITNVATSSFNKVTINGQPTKHGVMFHSTNARMLHSVFNNCDLAVLASQSGLIHLYNTSGTNNTRGIQASGAIILYSEHTLQSSDRAFESYNGGLVINAAVGEALTKDAYSLLIGENTFRNRALASAMTNNISTLLLDVYEDTTGIDGTLGDAAAIIANYYRPLRHMFEKTDAGTVTMYTTAATVTTGNDQVWVYADYTLNGGTIQFAISRDGGANYTVVSETDLNDISATPAGNTMKMRVTITGAVSLRNVAWGCKE